MPRVDRDRSGPAVPHRPVVMGKWRWWREPGHPPIRVACLVNEQETSVVFVMVTVGVSPENCPDTDQIFFSKPPAAAPPDVIPVKLPFGFMTRFSIVWLPRPPTRAPESRPCATVNRTTKSPEHPCPAALPPPPPPSRTSQVPLGGPAAATVPITAKAKASPKRSLFI